MVRRAKRAVGDPSRPTTGERGGDETGSEVSSAPATFPHESAVGTSVEGRPIRAIHRPGNTDRVALILGGFHGDEPTSVAIARRLTALLADEPERARDAAWCIVSPVNPDGYQRRTRRNARGVDLNRNFPTANWAPSSPRGRMHGGPHPASEPETRAVISIVERLRPAVIVTVHSISGDRHCNNYDGPGEACARALHRHNGYPVRASIGYPTPGSFGTWAGHELGIPVVTLELPSRHSARRCWLDNRDGLLSLHAALE